MITSVLTVRDRQEEEKRTMDPSSASAAQHQLHHHVQHHQHQLQHHQVRHQLMGEPTSSDPMPPGHSQNTGSEYTWRCADFHSRLVSALDGLWETGDFVDVTLACEGQCLKAHRLVLSMGSEYFKSILRDCDVRSQHPVVFFRDISFSDLKCVVDFLYTGTVTVKESNFESFLKTADSLQVDGLTFVDEHAAANVRSKYRECLLLRYV